MSRVLPSLVLLACIAWLPTHVARAQPAEQTTPTQGGDARRLFEQGLELADQERWGEAVDAFRQSRAIVERPSTVFNLGNALFRVGRMTAAIAAFDDFVRIAHPRRDRAQVAEATRLRGVAQTSLATLVIDVMPADATLTIDGDAIASTGARREIALDPGRHDLRAVADGHEPYTTPITLSSGARTELAVRLAEERPPAPAPPAPPAMGRLLVHTTVRGATVRVGDETIADRVAHELPPGTHDVVATARGFRRFERTVRIEPGETTTLDVTLVRVATPARSSGVLSSPVFWIVTGVVVVGAGVTVGVVAASSGTEDFYTGTTGVVLR